MSFLCFSFCRVDKPGGSGVIFKAPVTFNTSNIDLFSDLNSNISTKLNVKALR